MANKITYNIGFNPDTSGLDKLKQQLSSLQQYSLNDLVKINTNATQQDLTNLQKDISIIQNALDQSYSLKLNSTNIATFNQELHKSGTSLTQLQASLNAAGTQGQMAFKNLVTNLFTTNQQLRQSHSLLDSMAKTLGNTIKWSIASSAINTVTGSIQKAWGFTKALDQSLTDIRIVTGDSADEMDRFAKQAQKSAKALGTATTEYTKAALIFYQQGLNDTDVAARTDATIKAANVTGQSAAEVSEQLTAVWNGYKVVAEEAEMYVDKLAAVAASTAADLEELSTGMSKVASSANAMGVNIDQLSAQLSTIVSVTRQDASLVGTALKTIYARMGDLKVDGVDEFGTSLGDVSGQMRQMGIEVLDQEGNLRDMGSVIEEVAKKWGTWTDAQQQAAAVAIAGKRQYNNLIALFENWDMYESSLATSENSAGTLQRQQDIYIDSLEGKLEQLGVAGEKIFDAMFDSDSMKDLIEGLTTAAEIFANFIDNIGGGGALLGHLGVIALNVFKKQIAGGIATAWNNVTGYFSNASLAAQEMLQYESLRLNAQNSQDANLKQIVQLEGEQLQIARFLSAEDKARFNEQLKLVSAAQDKLTLAKQEEEALEKQLSTAQELLDTHKIYSKFDNKAIDDPDKVSGEQIRDEKGQFTSDYKFNLDTDAGRQAASQAIDTRLTNLKGSEGDLEDIQSFLDVPHLNETSEDMDKVVGKFSSEEDGTFADSFIQNYQGNPEDIEALRTANEALADAVNRYKEAAEATKAAEEALATARANGEDTTAAEAAVEEALTRQRQLANTATSAATKVAQRQQAVISKDKKALEGASKALKNFTDQQKKAKDATQRASNALSKAVAEHKKMQAAAKSKAMITNITNTMSAVGSLASSISSLINVFDILNDTEMSGPEKALAVFQNLGMTIPMLVSSIGSVITGFAAMTGAQTAQAQVLKLLNTEKQKEVILNSKANAQQMQAALASAGIIMSETAEAEAIEKTVKGLTKKQTKQVLATLLTNTNTAAATMNAAATTLEGEALEKTGTKGMVAGLKIQAGFWPVLVIGLILIAVIGTIILLFAVFGKKSESAHEKAQKALKAEEETLAALQENYKKLVEEINKTKTALDELKEKQKILNSLTVGTEAWTDAVYENNEQVLDLLSSYSELAPYITTDSMGVMSITTEGEEELIKNLENKASKVKTAVLGQQIDVLSAKNDVILTNMEKNTGGTAISEYDYTDDGVEYRSDKSLAEIVENDKMDDLAEILSNADNVQDADTLMTAMKDADIFKESITVDKELAQSMLDQSGAIYAQITSTEANTNAIKALESAIVAEYYKDNADRSEAESASAWDAIAGARAAKAKDSDKIKDKVKVTNDKADSDAQDGISGDAVTYLAQAKGVSKSDIKIDDKNNKVKITNAEGEVEELSMSDAVDIARRQAGVASLQNQTAEVTKLVNAGYSAGGELINLAGGKASVAFDEEKFTAEDLKNLDASKDAMFKALDPTSTDGEVTDDDKDNIAKTLGYDDYAAYERAYTLTKVNTQNTINKIDSNMASSGLGIGWDTYKDSEDYSKASIAQLRDISAGFEQAFKTGGTKGVQALQTAIESFAGDPATQAKVADIASQINWMDVNAANDFRMKLEEAGVSVEKMGPGFDAIVAAMSAAENVAGSIAQRFNSIRSSLAEIQKLSKDLETGDIISDEDYKNLIKYNAEAKDLFMLTADGYKFIGNSGKALAKQMSKDYLDIDSARGNFATLRASAENFADKKIAVSNSTSANQATAAEIVTTEGWKDLLASQGNISSEAFLNALNIINDPAADKASQKYKDAVAMMEQGISDIASAQTAYEAGDFDGTKAEELWATSYAQSWKDVQGVLAYKDVTETDAEGNETTKTVVDWENSGVSKEVYDKAETFWKNSYLDELGFSGDYKSSFGAEELEGHLENIRKLELDYFADINNELSQIGEALDRAFGADKINLIQRQVELQKQSLELSMSQSKAAKATFDSLFTDFIGSNAADLGVSAESLKNADGSLNLKTMNDLLASTTDEDARTNIQRMIDLWGTMEDSAAAATEAQWALVDAQIAQFKSQSESAVKIAEWNKSWKEFKRGFEKISTLIKVDSVYDEAYSAYEKYVMETSELSNEQQLNFDKAKEKLAQTDTFKGKEVTNEDVAQSLGYNSYGEYYLSTLGKIDSRGRLTEEATKTSSEKESDLVSALLVEQKKKESAPLLNAFGPESAVDAINNAFASYQDNSSLFTAQTLGLDTYGDIADNMEANYDTYLAAAAATKTAQKNENNAYLAKVQADVNLQNAQDELNALQESSDNFSSSYTAATNALKVATDNVSSAETALANAKALGGEGDTLDYDAIAKELGMTESDELTAAREALESAKENVTLDSDGNATGNASGNKKAKKQKKAYEAANEKVNNLIAEYQKSIEDAKTALVNEKQGAYDLAVAAQAQAETELKDLLNSYANELGHTFTESADTYEEMATELKTAFQNQIDALNNSIVEEGGLQDQADSATSTYTAAMGQVAAASAAQKNAAEVLAKDNPYASVSDDGVLLWDAAAFTSDWENAITEAQGTLEEMQGNLQDAYQGYLDAQAELMGLYDTEISKLSSINSILASSADLWKMVGKNAQDFTSQLNGYYSTMTQNSKKSYDLALTQLMMAQEQYNNLTSDASEEMVQTVTNNLATASENVMSMASEWMSAISNQFSVALSSTIDDFISKTNELGLDLAGMSEEWSLSQAKDERYVDDVNSAFGIEELERKFQGSIDATDSITAQKKLNSAMQEQLKILKEKDKLSQYDLDRANAIYDLTLKQIALEEAQQTANKMKLTRDASGNYTYQYVQDQDAVAQAEADLAAAENSLYNMDKDRSKELVDDYYNTMSEANSSISEAIAAGDIERAERLKDYYFGPDGILSGIQSELQMSSENLDDIGKSLMGSEWTSSLTRFSDAIAGSNLADLTSSINTLFTDENGAVAQLKTVSSTVESLLTKEDSALVTAVGSLNDSLKSSTDLASKSADLILASNDVLNKLPILTANLDSLSKTLETYGDRYTEWLESQTGDQAMLLNTAAIELNTTAMNDLTTALKANVITETGGNADGEANQGAN